MADEFGRDGIDQVALRAAEAGAALEALKVPAQEAADAIEAAFGRAGDSLTRSLARAAADGEVSLAELARAVLNAVNAAAGANGGGLSAAIQSVMSSFGGARADGGPVLGGGAYLVGERGPEVFRPATGGEIGPVGGGALRSMWRWTAGRRPCCAQRRRSPRCWRGPSAWAPGGCDDG